MLRMKGPGQSLWTRFGVSWCCHHFPRSDPLKEVRVLWDQRGQVAVTVALKLGRWGVLAFLPVPQDAPGVAQV